MNAVTSHRLRFAFYGDDFTGSTDALEVLAFAGLRCALFLEPPTPEAWATLDRYDAIGVAGDSRGMTPDEMSDRLPAIFRALHALAPDVIHYKVCSTFDSSATIGSIGRVLEIALDTIATAPVPIVAGTPALQRYCLFGQLFARAGTDGKIYRIDRHPVMRAHPVTPMDESDLIRFFGRQTSLPMVNFPYTRFDAGREALDASFAGLFHRRDPKRNPADTGSDRAPGKGTDDGPAAAVLFDAATPNHLTEIGRLISNHAMSSLSSTPTTPTADLSSSPSAPPPDAPIFVIGSSGVEYAMTQWWAEQGALPPPPAAFDTVLPAKPVLTISGSASPVAALQIDAALAAGFYEIAIDAAALIDETLSDASMRAVIERAVDALNNGMHVMMHTAKGPDDDRIETMLRNLMATGVSRNDAKHRGGRLLGERLGHITEQILIACRIPRIVISGGDTSSRITQALAPDALEVAARLSPGAPLCRVISGKPHLRALEIALKGGQMGHTNYFVDAAAGNVSAGHL